MERSILKRRFYALQNAYDRALHDRRPGFPADSLRRCVRLCLCIARMERLLGHRS